MKVKTHKATVKRLNLHKNSKSRKTKIMHKTAGQDHFNARESGSVTRNKRRDAELSNSYRKSVKTLIQGVR